MGWATEYFEMKQASLMSSVRKMVLKSPAMGGFADHPMRQRLLDEAGRQRLPTGPAQATKAVNDSLYSLADPATGHVTVGGRELPMFDPEQMADHANVPAEYQRREYPHGPYGPIAEQI